MKSAWEKAQKTLTEKADRMRSNAPSDSTQKMNEASTLDRFAEIVAEGPDAVTYHLASTEYSDSIRKTASVEVHGLALRRENLGSTRNLSAPIQSGWQPGKDDLGLPIHLTTMLEAIELHKISLAFHYDEYWTYLLGLLLERVGDFEQAIKVFESLQGSYAQHATLHIKRCRAKIGGTHDAETEIDEHLDEYADALNKVGQDGRIVTMLKGLLKSKMKENRKSSNKNPTQPKAHDEPLESDNLEAASCVAQRFAEFLSEGQFEKAAELVASSLDLSANDLKVEYEEMTIYDDEPDPGPFEVMVMQCTPDMPNMEADDVAWAYVSISGTEFNEAVTVMISQDNGGLRITDLEWGRP